MNQPLLNSSMTGLAQRGRYTSGAAVLLLAGLLGPAAVLAQSTPSAAPAAAPTAPAADTALAAATAELSEGEVVRWDPRTSKVTLRHGPIKNLDMPP